MVFFYSNNPPRTTPMTTPISLKSTRLEILLEVTEDRGIESGGWDLEQQITLPSVERVGVDLRKKRTGEWGSRKSFFPSFLCSRCVWEKCSVGGHEGGWVKATQRVPRIWREEYESIHTQTPHSTSRSRRQGSMEISSIEVLLACLGCQYYYSTKCEMLVNLTAKNSDYRPYNAFKTTFKTSLIWLVHGGEAHDSWWGITGTLVFRSTVQEQVEVREEPKDVKGEFGWSVCEETGWKYGEESVNRVVQDTHREKGKDSQKKKLITCNERKQPEKVTVKSANKDHSKNNISKAKGTLHKAHKHPQNSLQTHNKDQYNSMKRSKSGKKERKVPHTQVK